MAHPYLVNEPVHYGGHEISRKEFIQLLIDAGLDGIEACYPYDKTSYGGDLTPQEIQGKIIQDYADTLLISGGSDYHAEYKKGQKNPRDIGDCGITFEEFQRYDKLLGLLHT